tara:strand:- start:341 stop:463 length:123 start_codon:yes stop_codon:yes gene_type:complete
MILFKSKKNFAWLQIKGQMIKKAFFIFQSAFCWFNPNAFG